MSSTKNRKQGLFFKSTSAAVIMFVSLLAIYATNYALKIETHYSPRQFQPEKHTLLNNDEEIRASFQLDKNSPHILLLSLSKDESWLDSQNFIRLEKITSGLSEISNVENVISLSNVETAVVDQDNFYVGRLKEMFQNETGVDWILKDPLLSPHLISKNGRHTAIVVSPKDLPNDAHLKIIDQIRTMATIYAPNAKVQVGGPAAIRTQIANLLSSEIIAFVGLSFIGAMLVLLFVFKGWTSVPTTLFVVFVANVMALGLMSMLGLAFTILSTTVPIIVTITVVAICTHSMVRMGEEQNDWSTNKYIFILKTMKELAGPHMLTAVTTMVGFGTLIFSEVPLIKEYGMTVAAAVPIAAFITLLILPAMLFWVPLPSTRNWLSSKSSFANFVTRFKTPLFAAVVLSFLALTFSGKDLHWTSRMFDDLPKNQEARVSTEFISKNFGGIIPLEISIGSENAIDPWRNIRNIKRLDKLTKKWKTYAGVGSVIGLNDFVRMSNKNKNLPKKSNSLSETYLVYGMSYKNPLNSFLTPNQKYTRVSIKFRDIPSNLMQKSISKMQLDLREAFPKYESKFGGLAATIHPLNEVLSRDLMFGFFYAMFWILILLSIVFKSWKWSLVSAIPNLIPPVALLGALAISETPIKPSIAIIFAISLGIAFDNTVYILGRLKQMLKEKRYDQIPVKQLLLHEASPCFVTSFSLFMGFSIFLFSYFNMNKVFGLFMLLSIVAGLVGDLILLPATLKLFPQLLLNTASGGKYKNGQITKGATIFNSTFSIFLLAGSLMLLYSQPLGAGVPTANGILKKVELQTSPPNETANIQMKIVEPDGSKKIREITIKRKNTDGQMSMVRIQEPKDLKGVSLLSISEGKDDDQWLYLPSSKRSRRIVGSGKKGRFLDSELNYEDLRISTYSGFKNKVVKTIGKGKRKMVVIESQINSSESSYSKILTWVSLNYYRIEKAEYYDEKGKLIKTMSFKKYKRYGKKYWRAQEVTVKNVQDNRSTTLVLKNVSLKSLGKNEFSKTALAEGA